MRASMLSVLAALLLAACSSSPTIVSGTQQSVAIEYDGKNVTRAVQAATTYCGALGKQAILQGSAQQDKRDIATFNCI
jgi:uncharacterized protein YcfL